MKGIFNKLKAVFSNPYTYLIATGICSIGVLVGRYLQNHFVKVFFDFAFFVFLGLSLYFYSKGEGEKR